MTGHRLPAYLGVMIVAVPLMLLLVLSAPAAAADVPFSPTQPITNSFYGGLSVAVVDVDGDGRLDVLGAAEQDGAIAWWKKTAGGWSQYFVSRSFDGARSAAAADLDGDGNMDVLGAAYGPGAITWWKNTAGDGTAWITNTVSGDVSGARSAIAADVDGDGDLDVLGASSDSDPWNIAWWENMGGGIFASTPSTVSSSFAGVQSIAAADLDGDGDLDVLGASPSTNVIAWWENELGDGTYWTLSSVTGMFVNPYSVTAADLDGDGDLDVLAGGYDDDNITWWANTAGDGSAWTEQVVASNPGCIYSVTATDVDRDGDLDVVAGGVFGVGVAWWENARDQGIPWTEHAVTSGSGSNSVAAADLDGDGDVDVVGSVYTGYIPIAWWENETIHRSAAYPEAGMHTVSSTVAGAYSGYAADLDGDGDLDVLGVARDANSIVWWENLGAGVLSSSPYTVTSSMSMPASAHAADIDGDGDLDVVGTGFASLAWWENVDRSGTVWAEQIVSSVYYGGAVSAADLDGDGDMDMLCGESEGYTIAWWENSSPEGDGSTWVQHVLSGPPMGYSSATAADLDGDGDLDVLATLAGIDTIAWWDNAAGDGSEWVMNAVTDAFDSAISATPADVDGDGDLDIVAAAIYTNTISWFENTAGDASAWTEQVVTRAFFEAASVSTGDLDGDGDLDVLGKAWMYDGIAWWEDTSPQGGGSAWAKHVVTGSFESAGSVAAADVDGDGDLDVLGTSFGADTIAWWENRGGQFALATTATAPETIESGHPDDVLKVTVTHLGRPGDGDEEWRTLELLLEETPGVPLDTATANALIDRLAVYLDDGSGTFEPGADLLVTAVYTLTLWDGRQTVSFAGGDPNVQVAHGTPRTYFVVVTPARDLGGSLPEQVIMTHVTEPAREIISSVEDRDHDLRLALEYSPDTRVPLSLHQVSTMIEPGQGGTLVYTDTQGLSTTLQVPPAAISECVRLVYTPLVTPTHPLGPDDIYAHHAFYLHAYPCVVARVYLPLVVKGADQPQSGGESASQRINRRASADQRGGATGISGSYPSSVAPGGRLPAPLAADPAFQEPVTITIHYSDADVGGVLTETLELVYWNGNEWLDMAGTCDPPSVYYRDRDNNILRLAFCHMSQGAVRR